MSMAPCLFIFHPFDHFFNARFLSVHQNTYTIDFGREPDDKYGCGKQQGKRECQFPYRNVEWQADHHHDRGGERNH